MRTERFEPRGFIIARVRDDQCDALTVSEFRALLQEDGIIGRGFFKPVHRKPGSVMKQWMLHEADIDQYLIRLECSHLFRHLRPRGIFRRLPAGDAGEAPGVDAQPEHAGDHQQGPESFDFPGDGGHRAQGEKNQRCGPDGIPDAAEEFGDFEGAEPKGRQEKSGDQQAAEDQVAAMI
jgi:hypothetical protein